MWHMNGTSFIWQVRLEVIAGLGHCEPNEAEATLLADEIHAWGLMDMAPLATQARPAADDEAVAKPSPAKSFAVDSPAAQGRRCDGGRRRSSKGGAGRRRSGPSGPHMEGSSASTAAEEGEVHDS